MALTRQVITALQRDGSDMLGTKRLAIKIADESIVSGSLLTVESNHFCVLKSRGAVLSIYETGQYALVTPDKPIIGSIAQGFFGGSSPWVYEVIYINRAKLLVRCEGVATSSEMAEMAYQVDFYIHIDTRDDALALITHMPFNGTIIDTQEVADYAGPAVEQAINQIVQVTKMESINEHITEIRESVKVHLTDFLRVYGIMLNDLKVLIRPRDERMRELISLQAIGLTPIEAIRYYLALRMADRGLGSAPNAAAGAPFYIGGNVTGFYPVSAEAAQATGQPPAAAVTAGSAFYDQGALGQVAINLFYGWGYNFYREENLLRADDLLIRAKTGMLLGQARAAVEKAEAAHRRAMPAPTRANPFPPAEAMAGAQALERLSRAIGALEAQIRAQPAPENDRMSQVYRSERGTLTKLCATDERLIGQAEVLRAMVDGRDGAGLLAGLGEVEAGLEAIVATLRERQAVLVAVG